MKIQIENFRHSFMAFVSLSLTSQAALLVNAIIEVQKNLVKTLSIED